MIRGTTLRLGSQSSYRYGVDSYDATKLGLGKGYVQMNGANPEDKFAGVMPTVEMHPNNQATASFNPLCSDVVAWRNDATAELDWIFYGDGATAAATRRIGLFTLEKKTQTKTWKGFITITFPVATNITIRGLKITYDKYTTGTVSVSGTAVTGSGTAWQTAKCNVGNRIGFGSTDPAQITTWYEISAIGSDTEITLTASAGTIAGGTAFVIEDLRAVIQTTNATATNGGLFLLKGLSFDQFSSIGGTVPAAVSTDNIRACYWLADAATVTNTVSYGVALEPKVNDTTQYAYVLDTTANPICFKYNIRAALTLSSGKDTTAFQFKTGSGGALTGTPTQVQNVCVATASHGPLSGVAGLYFTTATRIYATALSNITTGSTTWLSSGYTMTEVPPGSTTTITATALMANINYIPNIDKFFIMGGVGTGAPAAYISQYRTDGLPLDRYIGAQTSRLQTSTTDSGSPPHFQSFNSTQTHCVCVSNNTVYYTKAGGTVGTQTITAMNLGSDWEYVASGGGVLVSPKISTPNASKYTQVTFLGSELLGEASGTNLGLQCEPVRLYYRTAGIDDNSGTWTLVDGTGIITADGATHIQLKIETRAIGMFMCMPKIFGLVVLWEDLSTDSHYQYSVGKSDLTNKRFTWRHSTEFGSSVPQLRVRLFDSVTGGLLVDDDSTTQAGTWERSTNDGGAWSAWSDTDKGNETTYIRFTPASLADNIKVRPVLTQY